MSADLILTRVWHCGAHRLRIDVPRVLAGEPVTCIVRWPPMPDDPSPQEVLTVQEDFVLGRDTVLALVLRELGVRAAVTHEPAMPAWLLPAHSNEPGRPAEPGLPAVAAAPAVPQFFPNTQR